MDKRVDAMLNSFAETDPGMWIGEYPAKYTTLDGKPNLEAALQAADAADDHVRVPREVLQGMLGYVNAHYENACNVLPPLHQTRRALGQIADDLEEWQDGHFKKSPGTSSP